MPSERPADLWPLENSAPPKAPRPADLALIPDYPPVPGYPAVPPYLSVRDRAPVPDWPPMPPTGVRALPRRLAPLVPRIQLAPRTRRVAGNRRTVAGDGRRVAALGYLTVPVVVVPLLIYLSTLRGAGPARWHAAQALNVWFTGALYDLSAVVMGAMLALDSPRVALIVVTPLIVARWLVTLTYLVRAARAASRDAPYAFPAWLCLRAAR